MPTKYFSCLVYRQPLNMYSNETLHFVCEVCFRKCSAFFWKFCVNAKINKHKQIFKLRYDDDIKTKNTRATKK